jgi:hypothetical protein
MAASPSVMGRPVVSGRREVRQPRRRAAVVRGRAASSSNDDVAATPELSRRGFTSGALPLCPQTHDERKSAAPPVPPPKILPPRFNSPAVYGTSTTQARASNRVDPSTAAVFLYMNLTFYIPSHYLYPQPRWRRRWRRRFPSTEAARRSPCPRRSPRMPSPCPWCGGWAVASTTPPPLRPAVVGSCP